MSVPATERRPSQHSRLAFEWRSRVRGTFVELPARSRRKISEHRHRRKQLDRKVSDQSRQGLDWTNFFMADVQMGFGAFLAFYLAQSAWTVESVGVALTIGGQAGVLAQIPGGALADAVRWKRGHAAIGIVMIATSALILALRPSFLYVVTAEILHGLTAGIVGPLGITGPRPARTSMIRRCGLDNCDVGMEVAELGRVRGVLVDANQVRVAARL